jgi:phage protein D
MSSFDENIDVILKNNQAEILGLLHQMHALGPAFQAYLKICKDNKIKPLRKRKGQYNPNKRDLTAYNIYTKEIQKDPKLVDMKFEDRSKLIGEMWAEVKANKKKWKIYTDKADEAAKKKAAEVVGAAEVAEVVVDAPVKKGKAKKAPVKKVKVVKRGKKKKGEQEKVVDPSEVSDEEVFMEDSDDVFEDSDAEVSE